MEANELNISCLSIKDICRFWSKVSKTEKCWIWKGTIAKKSAGYGRFSLGYSGIGAHRLSYLMHHGNISKGMNVLHKCDNPICVNPEHLFLGSYSDNARDMNSKNRNVKGMTSGMAKLDDEAIKEIRNWYLGCGITQRELADLYGVDQTCISAIILNKTWKHI